MNLGGIQISNTLLLVLLIPIITRHLGLEKFGLIMFSSRFAQLAGTVVNYGTNQSGVRDVATHAKFEDQLSKVFYNTLTVRFMVFLLVILLIAGLKLFHLTYYNYLLLSIPMIAAEVINPLFFFIGMQKIKIFNLVNLLSNALSLIVIYMIIKQHQHAEWVNFALGALSVFMYLALWFYIRRTFNISYYSSKIADLQLISKANFYLTVNNISVHLQQSIIIFALTEWGNTMLLGAYTLCDRIIGQCRNLLITISNAVYPKAVAVYNQNAANWQVYRRKMKYALTAIFFFGSVLIFFLADFIVFILSKEHNDMAATLLKIMAIVPVISALNVLNVLDQLLKNSNKAIFNIALILLVLSFIITYSLLQLNHIVLTGAFTVVIEFCALLMYEYIVNKTDLKNV
ncbi:oligosaccharide flippase family protein [Mucilaginibacter sp. CSA2-8R]|uniref:oligosaccharide flippase family protein n=1 Tax=Mucilaginibacter sp. CSA2-8R TaxID=3141542 RepID=UPI00315DBF8B